jgi:hypothetical protein
MVSALAVLRLIDINFVGACTGRWMRPPSADPIAAQDSRVGAISRAI